jgi:hypothetical protein
VIRSAAAVGARWTEIEARTAIAARAVVFMRMSLSAAPAAVIDDQNDNISIAGS